MDTMRHTPAVTFQRPSVSQSGDELEEVKYVKPARRTVDKPSHTSEKKCSFLHHLLIITVSWGILLLVTVPRIYLTSVLSENNAELMTENRHMEEKVAELNTVRRRTVKIFSSYRRRLSSKSYELQVDKKRLEEKIAELEEFNVSRTQSIIDAYCPIPKNGGGRRCDDCEEGWEYHQSNCYMIHDAKPGERRSWEDARKDCRAKGSRLAVIDDDTEKWFIMVNSRGHEGFWIGLKVEDGGWKWLDGTTLSQSSWIEAPRDGHCAASVNSGDLRALNCTEKNQWICEKKALTL